ncbi:uncharacterized protein LOC130928073 isoform X3 [Corythoichthys intestinalis]|uniref:uncharacterized protein LOC130928073 isoform X3 n=1 Tax=Corythoichthys intestinalis TaxID=161448 RepID=UPI0025A4FD21|nr:uncharacterized protein LOC130928073 isoform X3 [Corythoichthys intestinalis]
MRARTTPAAKFEAELCHQRSTSCKMQVKVVPCTLPDYLTRNEDKTHRDYKIDQYVSQAHRPEHQEPACIKEEEESGPIQGFSKYLGPDAQQLQREVQLPIKKEEVELPYVKEEDNITMSTGFSKYLCPDAQQLKREVNLPIKKEEVELPYVKEENDITMTTGEPSNSEDG